MIKKLFKIIFLISQIKDNKKLYYKRATVSGKSGCVQALLSDKMAKKLNLLPGRCSDIDCHTYKCEHNIPMLCTMQCFMCDGDNFL